MLARLIQFPQDDQPHRWPPVKPPPDGNKLIASIVGGEPVVPEDRYPYQVALTQSSSGGQYCGGSLIAPGWVLSAAHCAGIGNYVQIGRYDLNDNSESYDNIRVTREIVHEDYNDRTLDNDFMLLELSTDSKYTPVSIDSGSANVGNNVDVTVMGWGAISSGGPGSSELLEVELDIVGNTQCNSAYGGAITDNMLCAARTGKDACQGDSGGPLIIRDDTDNSGAGDVVVGVVSWGFGCADPNYPGVYARVSEAYSWIVQNADLGPSPPTQPNPPTPPTPTPPPQTPTFDDDYDDDDDYYTGYDDNYYNCEDEDKFLDKVKQGGSKLVLRDCSWLASLQNANKFISYCTKKWRYARDTKTGDIYKPPHAACGLTCHFCWPCNEEKKFKFFWKMNNKGMSKLKSCNWLSNQSESKRSTICQSGDTDGIYPSAATICPQTCKVDSCSGSYYYYKK